MSYNPSEHNVEEVKAHLEENPEEYDAVIEAERNEKNRQGITSLPRPGEAEPQTFSALNPSESDEERQEARAHALRDPQLVQAEAAKLLNRGEGQEPFKRQDEDEDEDDSDDND